MVGPHATDLIGEVLGVKASEGTIYELSEIIQPHPALLEAIAKVGMHTLVLQFTCSYYTYAL